jgi:hypothetical protein
MGVITEGKFWVGVGAAVLALIIFTKFVAPRLGGSNG